MKRKSVGAAEVKETLKPGSWMGHTHQSLSQDKVSEQGEEEVKRSSSISKPAFKEYSAASGQQ